MGCGCDQFEALRSAKDGRGSVAPVSSGAIAALTERMNLPGLIPSSLTEKEREEARVSDKGLRQNGSETTK